MIFFSLITNHFLLTLLKEYLQFLYHTFIDRFIKYERSINFIINPIQAHFKGITLRHIRTAD